MKLRNLILLILVLGSTCLNATAQENILSPEELSKRAQQSDWLLRKWVLKSWSGPFHSGGIEFKLECDGFISGYIFDPPKELQEVGYDDGMKVMHGITDTSSNLYAGATWSHQAHCSWRFRPTTRKRHSRKLPAEWVQGRSTVFFVNRDSGIMNGTILINKPNWYTGKYQAKDLRPLEVQLEEYLADQEALVDQLTTSGTEAERMEAADDFIENLTRFTEIRRVRRAVAVLRLLRERRSFVVGQRFEQALETFENSDDSDTQLQAWQTIRTELISQGAHLARTLPSVTLNDDDASSLFLMITEALKLRAELSENDSDNVAKLNESLEILFGIGENVEGLKDQGSGQFVDGIKKIITRNRATITASSIFHIPAEVVAGVIDVTRQGFVEVTKAVNGIARATNRAPSARSQMSSQARRIRETISRRSYGEAILKSIGDTVGGLSVVKKVGEWFL